MRSVSKGYSVGVRIYLRPIAAICMSGLNRPGAPSTRPIIPKPAAVHLAVFIL
jgi:hypothetical protein